MAKKTNQLYLSALFAFSCFVPAQIFARQVAGCAPQDLKGVLRSSDPEYSEAMELSQTLEAHGIVVKCVCRSKMIELFEGQKGAALFGTDQGDFEALFLPKPSSWTALEIIQTENNGWYTSSFRGRPKSLQNGWQAPRRSYFVKHAHELCVALDEQLSAKLNHVVN